MTTPISHLTTLLVTNDDLVLTWSVPLLLIALALRPLGIGLGRFREERRVRQLVRRLGVEVTPQVALYDGVDGGAFIDYLVLTPTRILVLTIFRAGGMIFGGRGIEQWARVVGLRTHHFPNPLTANQDGVLAVRYHAPGVPVEGAVLFAGDCSFPKGKPEGIVVPADLPAKAATKTAVSPGLRAAWETLREAGREGAGKYHTELTMMRAHDGGMPGVKGLFLIALAAGWIMWRLLRG